ncbi:MAG TPA: S8 family serine peptidase [Gammaproteobacteria bacterium]|nr:S8 family serine peptidase [Gammaproteobacteria bacterium]
MRLLAAAALALALSACATGSRQAATPAAGAERQILLTIRQPEAFAIGLTGTPSQRYVQRRYGPTPSVERILTQLAREHRLSRVDGWPIQSLEVYCAVLAVPDDRPLDDVIAALAADPRVDLVQPMNIFSTQTTRYDDPYADLQAGAIEMGVEQAHQLATGRGVSIAIIDSAVDASHPDLRSSVRIVRDLVTTRGGARSGEVHGTAVAGVIASAVNNREGIFGVAPDVSIAALRACWAVEANSLAAQCSSFSLARALEMAVTLKPNVINLSLAGPADPLLSRLLDEAIARGIIVVAAQPVSDDPALRFPSSHPKVFAAHSATDADATLSPYRLGAPATEVLTTMPGASYAFLSGNSLAAANMTGVIALLMERDPKLDSERIGELLLDSTTYAHGHTSINACRALEELSGKQLCGGAVELARF